MVIINNNWSPIPWGWGCGGHHHCNGNNWMQKMWGYQMLFGMMNNMPNMFRRYATPPQQQGGGFYPGLYLSGGGGDMPQSYEEYMAKAEENQAYNELKNSWTEFKITKIKDKYYANLKSDKSVHLSAESVEELMDSLNTYATENPDKFRTKETKKTTPSSEVAEAEEENAVENNDNDTVIKNEDDTIIKNNGGAVLASVDGHEWKNWKNLSPSVQDKYKKDMALDTVLEQLGLEKTDDNRKILRDANPNGIKDDKVTDLNKLSLLMKKETNGSEPVGPEGWDGYGENNVSRLNNAQNADEVINALLNKGFGGEISPIILKIDATKREKLKKDLIANNKDIFAPDGKVTGDLKKLVVPYVSQLQSDYKCTTQSLVGKGWVNGKNNPTDAGKINTYITNSNKNDIADAVVDQLAFQYKIPAGKLTQAIRNRIRKDLIYLNVSCFNPNGTRKDGFDINKLDYPNETTFKKYCGLETTNPTSTPTTSPTGPCP